MENKQEWTAASAVQARQMIKDIGTTVAATVIATESELLEQGGQEDLVQFAIMIGALNAIGGYVATRVYPEAGQSGAVEQLQTGLHQAIAALLQAERVTAALCDGAWSTGRSGTA